MTSPISTSLARDHARDLRAQRTTQARSAGQRRRLRPTRGR